MNKIRITFIGLLFACIFPVVAAENIKLFYDAFKTEEEAIDYIIDHYIPIISLERPDDRPRFRKLLRVWNPHIKDWREINSFTKINVYRKSPIIDLSVGHHSYNNKEEMLAENATINSKSSGPTFDVRFSFVHSEKLYSFINYRYLKKNDFEMQDRSLRSFPANHSLQLGFTLQPKFSRFSWGFIGEREELSFMSFNHERFRTRPSILRNLQISTSTLYWASLGLGIRFSVFNRGTYIDLSVGQSIQGEKQLEDGSQNETVRGFKAAAALKFFFYDRWWIRPYFQWTRYSGKTVTLQDQLGAYLGYSF